MEEYTRLKIKQMKKDLLKSGLESYCYGDMADREAEVEDEIREFLAERK